MRTEKNVIIAATRSSPECSASDSTPKLPVRSTRKVLSETSTSVEPTLSNAARFFSFTSSTTRAIITVRLDYRTPPHFAALGRAAPSVRCAPLCIQSAACLKLRGKILSCHPWGGATMLSRATLVTLFAILASASVSAQIPAPSDAAAVWNALSSPAMDPTKYAHVENVTVVRDAVHITLTDGTIQFARPVHGIVFAAVFHGNGRVEAAPPNPLEGQQLRLFTKQDKLNMAFTDATFSFTDSLLNEVAKEVKWQTSTPAADDLYANRQKEREDLGAEYLPRLFKGVWSPDRQRTAYFLADLKTKKKGWVEVRYDAMQPEEVRMGRWADVGAFKIVGVWMNFPDGGRDFRHVYD